MLVRLTESCSMGCNHCMVNSKPGGDHMKVTTLLQVVEWLKMLGLPLVMMLSGGEPTDHPDIVSLLGLLRGLDVRVALITNGEWLHRDPETRDVILDRVWAVQVTNDDRFYPRFVADYEHPKVTMVRQISLVSPFGRALTNQLEISRLAPLCFNLRSLVHYYKDIGLAIGNLRQVFRFCSPSINADGSISAGESPSCSKIGTVWDDPETITNNVLALTCSRCGLVNKLDAHHKMVIGEAV